MARDDALQSWLLSLSRQAGGQPLVLAFSGGLDSRFLLAALLRAGLGAQLRAVHVDHGLHPDSGAWAEHCRQVMVREGIDGAVERVRLLPGGNMEGRAREARYAALARHVPEGGKLVLAHHQDDQAETLLLRMLRGASVQGLSGMRGEQRVQGLWLWRPLLDRSRAWIEARALEWQLSWVEDPSNRDTGPDRNFLRQTVMPLLNERWPAGERLAAAARACEEASVLADELAALDARHAEQDDGLLVSALLALPAHRRANLVAWWLRRQGHQVPDRSWLARLHDEVLLAGEDREPRLALAGHVCCRYRDRLFLLPEAALTPLTGEQHWQPAERAHLALPTVSFHVTGAGADLVLRHPRRAITLRPARGGERILLDGMHRQVSELWRERGLPPWQRRRLPLLLVDDEVIAVPGIGVADDWQPDDDGESLGLRIEMH